MDQGYATTKTRPLRRDAERNRLLILSAARTVFAQRGLEATLDEVAKEAGLGVGTVYRRFPNRDALIDALFDDGLSEILRIVEEAEAEPRAWDGLSHFMTSLLEKQTADRGLRDVMLARRTATPEHDLLRAHLKPPLESLVRRAQQEGDLREDLTATDVGVLEVAVLGAAEFTALAAPGAWRRFLAIVLDGMRASQERGRERDGDRGRGGDGGGDADQDSRHASGRDREHDRDRSREGRHPASRHPLPAPPLDDDQIDACMVGWKYGSRETPRQRPKPPCAEALTEGGAGGRDVVDDEDGRDSRCGEDVRTGKVRSGGSGSGSGSGTDKAPRPEAQPPSRPTDTTRRTAAPAETTPRATSREDHPESLPQPSPPTP